jgi:DNA-3-methyladenine glycosylase
MSALAREFYDRPALRLARDLLGRVLVRDLDGRRLSGRIVETEAYRPDDPASHSFRGPTARSRTMFGPPGHLYVYRSMGIHHCMNVVAHAGSAVLIRALEPLEGTDEMERRRRTEDRRLLCAGPGRACQALGLDLSWDGHDLTAGHGLWIEEGVRAPRAVRAPRVGISTAVDKPWRFLEAGTRFASRPVPRQPARASG